MFQDHPQTNWSKVFRPVFSVKTIAFPKSMYYSYLKKIRQLLRSKGDDKIESAYQKS